MYLKYLRLYQFRNFNELEFEPTQDVNIIVGRNGIGKTNLLEAIGYLSSLRSHRASTDRTLMMLGKDEFSVRGIASSELGNVDVRIDYFQERGRRVGYLDGNRVDRLIDMVGRIPSVLFSPEDLNFVRGAPSERRRVIDIFISQLDREYLEALSRYNATLSQRNALLKVIQSGGAEVGQLEVWDDGIIRYGKEIVERRAEWIGGLSKVASRFYRDVTGGEQELNLVYEPSLEVGNDAGIGIGERLNSVREDDIRYGFTTVGPHRDDFKFLLGDIRASQVASQGQTRLMAIAFRLAQSKMMGDYLGERPILLLDDMGSELDLTHLSEAFRLIPEKGQVFVTTTREDLAPIISGEVTFWRFSDSGIVEMKS
ncbi:MAG TPA: DNA replication/repair protein RecF [Firmicutes bacterium]|nr:MAG: DNA replication/repair protein RecF [Candidatus Coatesbacteria bacterium]HDM42959.1 DNA replication/repair protein RecF [Bacillota bacterium]